MAEESRFVQATVTLPRGRQPDRLEQAAEEGEADLEVGGIADNLLHLLPLVCVSDGQGSTSKRVRYLNNLAKVIKCAGHVIEPKYPVERVIECVRLSLASCIKEVRAGALRVLRYLLTSKEAFAVMLKHRIDLFVARSLDVPADREIERLQAMRFVRQAISVAPDIFPRSLAAPLVSILLFDVEPQDNLTWSCMATLCELALHNPELASQSGAIRALVRGLLKCPSPRMSESVTLTLSHLLNKPSTRKFIRSQLDIETLLAPITDLHYRHLVDELDKSSLNQDNSHRVEASKMAIVALLKAWPGIFSLGSPHNTGLQPLLSMLPLTTPTVQKEILDVLYSVFQLKVPDWTESFTDAVTSIDPAQPKNEWSLPEGFVAAEGKDLLPPKTYDRTDLVNCYQALLLATLQETGLFECLVEVCLKAERHVAVMATILLAQLLHQTNTILPPGYSSDAHSLPDLIASAIDFVEPQDQRHRASEVISCLDRVHQLKKERVKPSSLYLKLILEQSGYFLAKKKGGEKEQQHITSDLDEATLNSLIRDTNVLSNKNHRNWDWTLIHSLLQHPSLKPSLLQEDSLFARFIKRLRTFYMPSQHTYSMINYSEANTKRYSAVGQELVKYLCRVEDVSCDEGLLDICNYPNRSDLMRLMISTLDFAHDVHSRVILNKVLTATEKEMRLYATKHMRVLLRSKMPFFNSWGLELLLPQLYDIDRQVAMEAVEILDEACDEDTFLEALVLEQPQLLHLGEKGAALFTRFFSVKRGFTLMSRMGYLELQLENWFKEYNFLYVYIVEERLAETLTSFKQTEEGEFVRRNNTAVIFPKAFVPVHLYGQLVQHEEGCLSLEKENHVSRFAQAIRAEHEEGYSSEAILFIKAAIWALGHIGSSPGGLRLLLEEEVIGDLVDLAETSPVLSIRGTCFYALCLISKTPQGATILLEANWTAVRHSLEEKWPLAIDPNLEPADEPPFTPVIEVPLPPYELPTPHRVLSYKDFTADKTTTTLPGRVAALGLDSHDLGGTKIQTTRPSQLKSRSPREGLRKSDSTKSEIILSSSERTYGSLKRMSRHKRTGGKEQPTGVIRGDMRIQRRSQRVRNGQVVRSRPKSLNSEDFLDSPDEKRKLTTGSLSRSFSSSTTGNKPFLGVCLPMDISRLFEYEEPQYKGCITQIISAPLYTSHDHLPPHDPYHCLECSIPLIKHYHGIGMSISSDSLSSHFLYAPPPFHGVNSPRARAHTLDDNLGKSVISKLQSHNRSASDTLPTVANGNTSSNSNKTTEQDTAKGNSESAHLGMRQSRNQAAEGSEESGKDRLGTRGRVSRSPSPLVRMKKIHDSLEEAEMKGNVELVDRPSMPDTAKESVGTASSSQAATLKDPEILIQIVKPSLSEGGSRTAQAPPSPSPSSSSSSNQSQGVVDEASQEGRCRLQHAILEVVYGLSSDVSHKKNLTGLAMICHRFPSVVQDVCLYSQVMDLLSSYPYNLHTRRLIQSKFDRLSFEPLFAAKPQLDEEFSEDDFISSNSSSRRTSFSSLEANSSQTSLTIVAPGDHERPANPMSKAFRRRSSTSDSLRFREKFQSLSRSAEMHEHMMVESPHESEALQLKGNETFNSNGNNNSPSLDNEYHHEDRTRGKAYPGALESRSDSSLLTPSRQDGEGTQEAKSFESGILSVVEAIYDL